MINKELSEAAVELNVILQNTSPEIVNKIPKNFIDFIGNIASPTYQFEYDKNKTLEEQNIQPRTKGLIALIYKDFLCDEHEKQEYLNNVSKILTNIEKEKRERYNPDNLFKKNKHESKIEENVIENKVTMIKYKESIFKKFINNIKKIFHIS